MCKITQKVIDADNFSVFVENYTPEKLQISPLTKKARAKWLSKQFVLKLIEHNPNSPLLKSYKNTLYCSHCLQQKGKKLTSTYCKNRWCATCNRIRTGRLINAYESQLKQLNDLHFVTLTKVTVTEEELIDSIKLMEKVWSTIMRSRYNRKNKVKGLRKAECTTRIEDKYHYHFHIMIEGKENGNWLISEWLRLMGDKADKKAQDIRKADEGSLKELFKYFTKVTLQDKSTGERKLADFRRLDVVFRAMRGKRVYQPFGGLKMVSEELENIEAQEFEQLEEAEKIWTWRGTDWIDEFGECLTGYEPSEDFKKIFRL